MAQAFDFDPQLPALPLAFDMDAVVRLFVESWPGGGGPTRIAKAKLQDTKYQPSRRCVTTYALSAERSDGTLAPTIGVIEISPDGPTHRLYDDDPKLPWLDDATDAEGMRRRFAALLPDTTVHSCAVTPVRYRPGVRCVFRYDLQTGAGPLTFFGKLMGEGAAESLATIAALYDAREAFPGMPRVLPPLAYWPEVHMLIQAAVEGGAEPGRKGGRSRRERGRAGSTRTSGCRRVGRGCSRAAGDQGAGVGSAASRPCCSARHSADVLAR